MPHLEGGIEGKGVHAGLLRSGARNGRKGALEKGAPGKAGKVGPEAWLGGGQRGRRGPDRTLLTVFVVAVVG